MKRISWLTSPSHPEEGLTTFTGATSLPTGFLKDHFGYLYPQAKVFSTISAPINGRGAELSTDPLYLDVRLPSGGRFNTQVAPGHSAFLYTYEGSAMIGTAGATKPLARGAAGVLSDGDSVRVEAGADGAHFLLLAAKPLREPVVQYGPFVMNTREEIEQALADYRDGRLAAA